MSIDPSKVFEVSKLLKDTVRTHEPFVFNDGMDDYDVAILSLANPRVIGERPATRLRLAVARSGRLAAGATYYNQLPDDFPARHIKIPHEGPIIGCFDGGQNANDYTLPLQYLEDLKSDILCSL